jgi:adenylosuccinate synthase
MSNIIADVVVDVQHGDCGKGKITHHLARTGNYTHVTILQEQVTTLT